MFDEFPVIDLSGLSSEAEQPRRGVELLEVYPRAGVAVASIDVSPVRLVGADDCRWR